MDRLAVLLPSASSVPLCLVQHTTCVFCIVAFDVCGSSLLSSHHGRTSHQDKSHHTFSCLIFISFLFRSHHHIIMSDNNEKTEEVSYKESETASKNVADILAADNEDESLRKVKNH